MSSALYARVVLRFNVLKTREKPRLPPATPCEFVEDRGYVLSSVSLLPQRYASLTRSHCAGGPSGSTAGMLCLVQNMKRDFHKSDKSRFAVAYNSLPVLHVLTGGDGGFRAIAGIKLFRS